MQFHADPNHTMLQHLARINVERNDYLRSKGNTVENRRLVDGYGINILKHHSGLLSKTEYHTTRQRWIKNELVMEFPDSEWSSIQSHFIENDPLEGKTFGGNKAVSKEPKSFSSTKKPADIPCRDGKDCKKSNCAFKHISKRKATESEEDLPKKKRKTPSIIECPKCTHRHPEDKGCDECWSCFPEKRPTYLKKK